MIDMVKLVKIVRKIRKFKRIVTELNQIISYVKVKDINQIKDTIMTIDRTRKGLEKDIEFKCEDCKSLVRLGKCTGCKRDWLK